MKSVFGLILLLAAALPLTALADRLTAEEIHTIRTNLARAHQVLDNPKADLDPADRERLRKALAAAEKDFQAYWIELLKESAKPDKASGAGAATTGGLYAAAGVIAADDATVIGTADDILLPFIILGLMSTQVEQKLASMSPVDMSLVALRFSLSTLSTVATMVSAKKPGCACKCLYKGKGALIMPRQDSPAACRRACENDISHPQGYVCDKTVEWFR